MLVGDAADASVGADTLVELLINRGAQDFERVARQVVHRSTGVPADAVGAWLGALRWGVRDPTFAFGITVDGQGRPFDLLDGDLRIRPATPTTSSLHLAGRYERPFDRGAAGCNGAERRVASIAHDLVGGLVDGLVSSITPAHVLDDLCAHLGAGAGPTAAALTRRDGPPA